MKRGTPRHPKTAHLCELLDSPPYCAAGILELLWHFTAEFAPRGNIGRYSDKRIEAAIGWDKKPGELMRALRTAGWIDEHPDPEVRLVVHDWHEHADKAVKQRIERGNTSFLSLTAKVRKACEHMFPPERNFVALPEPEPVPEPKPNTCASNHDARLGDSLSSIDNPPFGTTEPDALLQVETGRPTKPPRELTADQDRRFTTWWAEYWLHKAKKAAREAFRKHVRTEERFQQVMAATHAQKPEMLTRESSKRPHGASWLNGERWEDETTSPVPAEKSLYTPVEEE